MGTNKKVLVPKSSSHSHVPIEPFWGGLEKSLGLLQLRLTSYFTSLWVVNIVYGGDHNLRSLWQNGPTNDLREF